MSRLHSIFRIRMTLLLTSRRTLYILYHVPWASWTTGYGNTCAGVHMEDCPWGRSDRVSLLEGRQSESITMFSILLEISTMNPTRQIMTTMNDWINEQTDRKKTTITSTPQLTETRPDQDEGNQDRPRTQQASHRVILESYLPTWIGRCLSHSIFHRIRHRTRVKSSHVKTSQGKSWYITIV